MLLSSFILFEWWRNFVLSECWRKCLPDLVLIRCPTWDLLVVVMQILNQHRRIKIDTESVFIPEKVRMWCTDACCAGLLAFSVVCLWWQFIFYVRSNGLWWCGKSDMDYKKKIKLIIFLNARHHWNDFMHMHVHITFESFWWRSQSYNIFTLHLCFHLSFVHRSPIQPGISC